MSALRLGGSRTVVMNLGIGLAALGVVAILGTAMVFLLGGGRWFVVATPSMGTTAPVGTLVLTVPASLTALHKGDIIAFHPSTAPSETYTHRVFAISADGAISTKGDINGAADPWTLHQADLIGKATLVLPGIGWLARAIPLLAVGCVAVVLLTRLVRSLQWRASLRIVGVSLVVSVAAYILRPFTGVVMLQTSTTHTHASATVVSTGLLPIRVAAEHGTHVDLLAGQVGHLSIPSLVDGDYYRITSGLHLSIEGWILFFLICSIPLLGTLIFGLPASNNHELSA